MDLINREEALACFWNYANEDGTGYDETDTPAYDRLQALPIVAEVEDCISRRDVLDAIGEQPLVWTDDDDYAQGRASQWEYDTKTIKALPSAQPERIRGKWIKRSGTINCSICKHSNWSECFEDTVMSFNYCPNCGADMRGEEND